MGVESTMMLRILRIPRYVIPSIYAHLQPKMWYETVIIYIYKKHVSPWRKIAYHPINNEMLKNIFFVAVCETHSVLLKLLMFNFKLFTQRSRMLRLNWMHFLHFCKQKFTALNYCIVQRILLERKGYEGNWSTDSKYV